MTVTHQSVTKTYNKLSFPRVCLVLLLMALWVILCVGLILYLPSDSKLSPALWLFVSATLMLLFMIKRLGGDNKSCLSINSISLKWPIIAISLALIYWFFDFWLINVYFKINIQESIFNWHQVNQHYYPITVFLSSVIMAPIFEELVFRGLVFNGLKAVTNIWFSAVISSLLFALIHWSWPEFMSIFFVGLLYAWLAHRSQSVITPMLAHMTHNTLTYLQFSKNPIFSSLFF